MHGCSTSTDIKTTDAATDVLSAPGQQHENAPPGSTNTLGFIAGLRRLSYFPGSFATRLVLFCVKICSGDDYCQYGLSGFMLYIDNSFAITRISPLWAGLIVSVRLLPHCY